MRFAVPFAAFAALLFTSHARADFDVATGTVVRTAPIAFGFEENEAAALKSVKLPEGALPVIEGALRGEWVVEAGIEGKRAVRVPAGAALVIGDLATFGSVHDARVELAFWARADGARPS